jgi:hypothetical protein
MAFTNWAAISRTSRPVSAVLDLESKRRGRPPSRDQRVLNVRGVSQQVLPSELLPHKHLADGAEWHVTRWNVVLLRSMPTECIRVSMILLVRR